jgi:uncharacterized protein YecE (DUF72 family)
MWWADRIQEWTASGQDAFVYFNSDGNANAGVTRGPSGAC